MQRHLTHCGPISALEKRHGRHLASSMFTSPLCNIQANAHIVWAEVGRTLEGAQHTLARDYRRHLMIHMGQCECRQAHPFGDISGIPNGLQGGNIRNMVRVCVLPRTRLRLWRASASEEPNRCWTQLLGPLCAGDEEAVHARDERLPIS